MNEHLRTSADVAPHPSSAALSALALCAALVACSTPTSSDSGFGDAPSTRDAADVLADVSSSDADVDEPDSAATDVPSLDVPLVDVASPDVPSPDVSIVDVPSVDAPMPDTACAPGEARCASVCVDLSTSLSHCGACGATCSAGANATAVCAAGRCAPVCVTGFASCDGDMSNGCEVDVRTSATHCGRCGQTCSGAPNATGACALGRCTIACLPGFSDCDGVASNGCETDISSDPDNCGACATNCPGRVCAASMCTVPRSCRDLHVAAPTLPSGSYTIDPDGPGAGSLAPYTVSCDMDTDGGGWTLIFVAPDRNQNSRTLDYTVTDPTLRMSAAQALLALRDTTMATQPVVASVPAVRFGMPLNWRMQAPFRYESVDETVNSVVLPGTTATPRTLRYGYALMASYGCTGPWTPTANSWGRVCVNGTTSALYAAFANPLADNCDRSDDPMAGCEANRRFTIAVR